jgi:nucleoside-diphosphate-sugar epimerase
MQTVLVTGGGGYLGSVLVHRLLGAGYRVAVLDSLVFGGQALLPLLAQANFRFIPGDVRDRASLDRALDGAAAVVHLAAIVGDPACAAAPETALAVNRDASIGLLDAAATAGVGRLIFASTCSNYGRMADTSVLATEEHELRPVSLYAETKVAVERELLSGRFAALCPTVLRFATLYGLSPRMRFDLTVNQFAAEMQTARKLTVFGEQFWRPYVHVRDAAEAIQRCLEAAGGAVNGQVFNVGATSQNFRKSDIVALVQQRLRAPAEITRVAKAEDPRDYRVAFDKIAATLGFAPRNTVESGIDEVVSAFETGIFPADILRTGGTAR